MIYSKFYLFSVTHKLNKEMIPDIKKLLEVARDLTGKYLSQKLYNKYSE